MDSHLPNAWLIAPAASCRVSCVLLVACLASSGCATVINGSTQRVTVASDPPGAQLYVNDAPAGVTPAFVDVPRRDPDLELRLEKDGYEPAVLPLERSRSGWIAGNVLLAGVPFNDYGVGEWVGAMAVYGILGWLQDVRSGGAYKRPSLVRTRLTRFGVANEESAEPGRDQWARPAGAPTTTRPGSRNRLVPVWMMEKAARFGFTFPRDRPVWRRHWTRVTDVVTLDRDPELRRQADGSHLRGSRRSTLAGADSGACKVEAIGDRCGDSPR